MSTDRNSPPLPSPAARGPRRASLAGQFADIFGARAPATGNGRQSQTVAGPIASAAIQAQQRRLSLTTVGLSGSSSTGYPLEATRPRAESMSSSTSGTVDESPFEDSELPMSSVPTSPFARRLSFGARALREMKSSTGSINGNGYDFAEAMRHRAERTSVSATSAGNSPASIHHRAKSVAVMEPPKELSAPPSRRPDAFQERILKGDFYMD